MPTVYDAQTSEPVNVSPDEAHAGIVSGKYALDADAGPVTLQGKDGQTYKAPPEKVAGALATGAYRLLTPDEELKHQVAREEAAKGTAGSLAAAGSSALNQLFLGLPSALDEASETPEQKAKREAVEQYHSTARLAGGAAGFGASALLGGEIFKGAGLAGEAIEHAISPAAEVARAGLGTRLAAKAANFATQGALMSTPQALIDATVGKDPQKAAETLLWGIGAGALLGGAGELLSSGAGAVTDKALSVLKEKVQNPETQAWLDQKATEWGARAFGAQKSQIAKEGMDRVRSAVDFAYEEGALKPGMSRQDLGSALDVLQDKYGKQIGDTIESLDGLMHRGEGAAIGPKPPPEILDAALKPGQLGDSIRTALDGPEMRMPMNADQARALELVAQSADALPSTEIGGQRVVKFEDAQKFVQDLRKKWITGINRSATDGGAKGLETVTALDKMKENAYQIVRNAVHDAGDAVAKASGEPALVGKLTQAKTAYAKIATLEKFAANLDAIQAGNRMVGLTDFISMGRGPMAAATGALGSAIGSMLGPAGAVAGYHLGSVPGAVMDFMAKKWMEDKGLVAISALAKRAAKEGPEVFSAVMASEGAKRLEATMTGVRDAVKQMAVRGIADTAPSGGSDHMKHLLGSTQGLTGDQAYSKLGARLTALASNPQALTAATSAASAPFAAGSPQLGAAYQQQLTAALQYLHQALPKPPAPAAPFEPDDWSPSAADKLAFHDKAEIVANPMRAMIHMQRGTLSDSHIDALQSVYPKILDGMRSEILGFSAQHPDVKLPMAERRSVSKLLGMPTDTISQSLPSLQATYAQSPPQQPKSQRAPKGKIRNMPSAASAFTGSQGPSATGA